MRLPAAAKAREVKTREVKPLLQRVLEALRRAFGLHGLGRWRRALALGHAVNVKTDAATIAGVGLAGVERRNGRLGGRLRRRRWRADTLRLAPHVNAFATAVTRVWTARVERRRRRLSRRASWAARR